MANRTLPEFDEIELVSTWVFFGTFVFFGLCVRTFYIGIFVCVLCVCSYFLYWYNFLIFYCFMYFLFTLYFFWLCSQRSQRNSANYVSFGSFHFQDFWGELERAGAKTCNIVPNAVRTVTVFGFFWSILIDYDYQQENDCVDIEVFFEGPSDSYYTPRNYAGWQYATSAVCVAVIALVNSSIF